MRRTLPQMTATAALLLYVASVSPAMSSDSLDGDEARASAALEAGADGEADGEMATDKTDADKSSNDEQAASAAVKESAAEADDVVCRKEVPTGSHRQVMVCRRAADIDASSAEVQSTMHRVKQYGNPTVTPRD